MFWRRKVVEIPLPNQVTDAHVQQWAQGVQERIERVIKDSISLFTSHDKLVAEREKLTKEISTLKIEKSQKEEEYARKEREIEHKVGLHKQQVTQDIALAKREASVEVKEANLVADRKRFEDQMKFVTENFAKETGYLKEIIGNLAERLPSLTMIADVGKHPSKK